MSRAEAAGAAERARVLEEFWLRKKEAQRNKVRGQVKEIGICNRPFPRSCLPPLQSESKCEVFVMVISSTLHVNEN